MADGKIRPASAESQSEEARERLPLVELASLLSLHVKMKMAETLLTKYPCLYRNIVTYLGHQFLGYSCPRQELKSIHKSCCRLLHTKQMRARGHPLRCSLHTPCRCMVGPGLDYVVESRAVAGILIAAFPPPSTHRGSEAPYYSLLHLPHCPLPRAIIF